MVRIVVDNETPEGRQRQLEAQVQIGFANVVSAIVGFLVGPERTDAVEAMRGFVALHDAAETESIDPNGIGVRHPILAPEDGTEDNKPINTILTGSLRMVATILVEAAKQAGAKSLGENVTETADYQAARDQIIDGIQLLKAKLVRVGGQL